MNKTPISPIEVILKRAGGSEALAVHCGITRQAFTGWKRKGTVPLNQVWKVAEITGMTACQIRPDYFPSTNKKAPSA